MGPEDSSSNLELPVSFQVTSGKDRFYALRDQARVRTDRAVQKNLYCLSAFFKAIGGAEALKITKDEIIYALAKIGRSGYSSKTKADSDDESSRKAAAKMISTSPKLMEDIVRSIWQARRRKQRNSKRVITFSL